MHFINRKNDSGKHYTPYIQELLRKPEFQSHLTIILGDFVKDMTASSTAFFPNTVPNNVVQKFDSRIDQHNFRSIFLLNSTDVSCNSPEANKKRVLFTNHMAQRWCQSRNNFAHPKHSKKPTDAAVNILDLIALLVAHSYFWRNEPLELILHGGSKPSSSANWQQSLLDYTFDTEYE